MFEPISFGACVAVACGFKVMSKLFEGNNSDGMKALDEFIINSKILRVKGDENDYAAKCYKFESTEKADYYYIGLPNGLGFDQLEKCKGIFENYFKKDITIESHNHNYMIVINYEVDKPLKEKYMFEVVKPKNKNHLQVVIGMTEMGPLIFDLSDTIPHILVGGTTGAGKSRLVKAILCNLIETYTKDEAKLVYLDNKGLECGAFRHVEHLLHRTTNINDTVSYLHELEREMTKRNKLIEKKDVTNIVDYNKKAKKENRLPFIFVVVDELYPFTTLSKKKEAYAQLGLLLSMSRSAGIHFLLATQRPTSDILPTLITANTGIAIGLRTRNKQESVNIIGEEGLEQLSIELKGRGKCMADKITDFQSYWLPDDVINKICTKHKKEQDDFNIDEDNVINCTDFKIKPDDLNQNGVSNKYRQVEESGVYE